MAGTDISQEIADLAAQEGAREYKELTIDRVKLYYNKFIDLRSQINGAYQRSTATIQQRYAIGRLAKQSIDKKVISYASSKGGANILPVTELQKIMEQYENDRINQLLTARQTIYSFGENQNLVKKLSLQAMNLVMMLKQDLTKTNEEHFAFIYKGEDGAAYSITVPMHTILLNETYLNNIELNYGDINRWNGGEDQKLSFKSSIIEQIRKTQLNGEKGQEMSNFINQYNSLKGTTYTKETRHEWDSQAFWDTLETAQISGLSWAIRQDKKYWVIQREVAYQTGFLAQGLFSKFLGSQKKIEELAKPDNNPWYGIADSYDKKNQLSYSVKSFLEGDPSLISLNSLYQVTENIINTMSSFLTNNTNLDEMTGYLKEKVFQGAKIVSDAFNSDIKKLINIIK